jgi:hypothetical protein
LDFLRLGGCEWGGWGDTTYTKTQLQLLGRTYTYDNMGPGVVPQAKLSFLNNEKRISTCPLDQPNSNTLKCTQLIFCKMPSNLAYKKHCIYIVVHIWGQGLCHKKN